MTTGKYTHLNCIIKCLRWFLPWASLGVVAILGVIMFNQKLNVVSGLTYLSAFIGSISAFLWIMSSYAPDVDSRRLNAMAGGFSGAAAAFTAGTLGNWPKVAYALGCFLIIASVVSTLCFPDLDKIEEQ